MASISCSPHGDWCNIQYINYYKMLLKLKLECTDASHWTQERNVWSVQAKSLKLCFSLKVETLISKLIIDFWDLQVKEHFWHDYRIMCRWHRQLPTALSLQNHLFLTFPITWPSPPTHWPGPTVPPQPCTTYTASFPLILCQIVTVLTSAFSLLNISTVCLSRASVWVQTRPGWLYFIVKQIWCWNN